MKSKIIKITCTGTDAIELEDAKNLQGEIKHLSKKALVKLKEVLKTKGFGAPLFIWKDKKDVNWLIDGVQRCKVLSLLKEEGWIIPKLPIVYIEAKDKKDAKERLLQISSQYGTFDKDELTAFIENINIDYVKLIDGKDINLKILEANNTVDDNEVNENVKAETKRGDIWELGKHKLLCGDSTDIEDVNKLMDGNKARMTVTSPPYFNQREYSTYKNYEEYLEFTRKVINIFKTVGREDNYICVWNIGSSIETKNYMPADHYMQFLKEGFKWIEWITWKKESATFSCPRSKNIELGYYVPALCTEAIAVYLLGENRSKYDIEDKDEIRQNWQTDLWEISKVIGASQIKIGHPAIYPIEIPYRAIKSYSQKGEIVFEPFNRSGTTIIACEKTERICYAMELSEHYCDVAVRRYIDWCEKNNHKIIIKHNGKELKTEKVKEMVVSVNGEG